MGNAGKTAPRCCKSVVLLRPMLGRSDLLNSNAFKAAEIIMGSRANSLHCETMSNSNCKSILHYLLSKLIATTTRKLWTVLNCFSDISEHGGYLVYSSK